MRIAIIGSGNVGTALAGALRRGGHEVVFGARSPAAGKADQSPIAEAVLGAGAVILAVPLDAAGDAVAAAGGLAGQIVIDATNPVGMAAGELALTMGFDTSAAERVATLAPGARVFKAFNQTGFENMADAGVYPAPPVMFVAGDDAAGKAVVLGLVADAGFEAIDAGDLRVSRLLEPLAMLWIELAVKRGLGPGFSFALQRRS